MSFFLSKLVRKSSFFQGIAGSKKHSWWSLFFQITLTEYLQFKKFNLLGHSAAQISPNKNPVSEGKHYNKKQWQGRCDFCWLQNTAQAVRDPRGIFGQVWQQDRETSSCCGKINVIPIPSKICEISRGLKTSCCSCKETQTKSSTNLLYSHIALL